MSTPTPTNHTTGAFFGLAASDYTASSLEEESSIDCSNYYEASSHTHRSGLPQTGSLQLQHSTPHRDRLPTLESLREGADGTESPTNRNGTHTSVVANTNNNTTSSALRSGPVNNDKTSRLIANDATQHASNVNNSRSSSSKKKPISSLHTRRVQSRTTPTSSNHSGGNNNNSDSSGGVTGAGAGAATATASNYHPMDEDEILHGPVFESSLQGDGQRQQRQQQQAVTSPRSQHSDDVGAWVVHAILTFFCGLIVVAVLLSFFVVRRYGFVAIVALAMVVTFAIFFAWFIDYTVLRQNKKFKPIRRKIIKVVEAAKQAVVDEYELFKSDWREHYLMLTNGEPGDDDNENDIDDDDNNNNLGNNPEQSNSINGKGPKKRSVVFKLVKPFLGIRKVFRRKRKNKKNKKSSSATSGEGEETTATNSDYEPPTPSSVGVSV